MLSLLVTIGLARAAPTLALPPGEVLSDWTPALEAAGLEAGVGGVRVETGAVWRLRYAAPGGERTATVAAPKTEEGREQVAIVAASLMRGGGGTRAAAAAAKPPSLAAPPAAPPKPAPPRAPTLSRAAARPPAAPAPGAPATVLSAPEPEPLPPVEVAATALAPTPPPPVAPVAAPDPLAAPAPIEPAASVVATATAGPSAPPRPSPIRVSAAASGLGVYRPGLGSLPGGALSMRVDRGPLWLDVAGATYAPTVFETGSLGLATLAFRAGVRAELGQDWGLFGGVGVVAERWSVVDLDGTRVAAGAGMETLLGINRQVGGSFAVEASAIGAWDAQDLRIDTLAIAPSRLSGGFGLALRVGT